MCRSHHARLLSVISPAKNEQTHNITLAEQVKSLYNISFSREQQWKSLFSLQETPCGQQQLKYNNFPLILFLSIIQPLPSDTKQAPDIEHNCQSCHSNSLAVCSVLWLETDKYRENGKGILIPVPVLRCRWMGFSLDIMEMKRFEEQIWCSDVMCVCGLLSADNWTLLILFPWLTARMRISTDVLGQFCIKDACC